MNAHYLSRTFSFTNLTPSELSFSLSTTPLPLLGKRLRQMFSLYRQMLHISIYDMKMPADHSSMSALLSPTLASGRRGLKDERKIMKCVF